MKKNTCVGYHYAQTNTNMINKTCALLQTTEGKDEPNIVFNGGKSLQTSQHGTQSVKIHNSTTQKNDQKYFYY